MQAFEAILLILLGAVALLAIARRFDAPYPALLALAGAVLALSPMVFPFRLDPQLALALFVAPVLLDAAYDTSVRDLRANWRPVVRMVLVAVGLTTAAVACVAHMLVPSLPWAAAIALGAVVAPPDAAAATTILRSVRLPHRLTVILEGESLLNDASALLIYRLAVGAAMTGGTIGAETIAPAFLISIVGSLLAGPLIGIIWQHVIGKVEDVPSSIILQFVGAFGVWIGAEVLGLSPILTVVAFAMTVAHYSPARTPARIRVPAYAVWETAVVVLNALAFVMIGVELGSIISNAQPNDLTRWITFSAAIVATVIVVRLVWVVAANMVLQLATHGQSPTDGGPGWRSGLLVGWCGMRGIVTVAAALALPENFPERDLLLFTAFRGDAFHACDPGLDPQAPPARTKRP